MRMKQLQEKLIRSRTSLPPRISSYNNKSRIVENGSCNSGTTTRNTIRSNNYYCSINTFKFIHFLSTVVIFCFPPLIIMNAIVYDQSIASIIVGFNLLLVLTCIYDLFLGYIEHWPNNKVSQFYILHVNNTNRTSVLYRCVLLLQNEWYAIAYRTR